MTSTSITQCFPNTTAQPIAHSNQNSPNIEVLSIEPGTAPGVLAIAAVQVGDMVIREIRVTNRGRGTFVNFPSRKIGDEWIELVALTAPDLRGEVVSVVLAAVRTMGGDK